MRKYIIIIAFISAFIISEIIVRYIIKYPVYGIEKSVIGLNENIYQPYSSYWDVEGGNHVYSRNNIGLQGSDINLNIVNKYIYVLGSSYIEAKQINPHLIATSIFQNHFVVKGDKSQVINLGSSGHDAIDSYFKLKYFEKNFKSHYIILVVEDLNQIFYNKHKKPLNFQLDSAFGVEIKEKKGDVLNLIRNKSAFINLILKSIRKKEDNIKVNSIMNKSVMKSEVIPNELIECLKVFRNEYKNRFMFLSIIDNDSINLKLREICCLNNIIFEYRNINKKENKINHIGHLNMYGNKLLGDFMYESYTKHRE